MRMGRREEGAEALTSSGTGRSRWREGLADGEDQEERGRCLRKEVLKSEGW